MKVVIDHWWNEIRSAKLKYSWKNLSQCCFVHHKTPDLLTWSRTVNAPLLHRVSQSDAAAGFVVRIC
jgi:hypothetical protein